MEIFGVSKFISVPVRRCLWLLIVKGSYRIVEKVFLVSCVIYLAYPLAALTADVPWGDVARALVTPTFKADGGFLAMMIGLVGTTTIAPWMQFYQQAAVVEKGITADEVRLHPSGRDRGLRVRRGPWPYLSWWPARPAFSARALPVETAADAAMALRPLVGQ